MSFPILTPKEAAAMIKNGDVLGLSGFTAAGSPKVITEALAARAELKMVFDDAEVHMAVAAAPALRPNGVVRQEREYSRSATAHQLS